MAYAAVKNFKAGLDRRGSQLTGDPGSLWVLTNGHLNRKGEVERRKKFVSKYSLPADTFGLHALGDDLYVFGSVSAPAVPSGITYQRLQHPDSSTAMSELLAAENFDGKIYAIAKYADDVVYHFYDGVLVDDWYNGVVRSDMTDNDGIADHLKTLVDADTEYSATRSTNVITITGPVGEEFTVTTEAENVTGGTDDQTANTATTQSAVAGVSETLATASFSITAGDDVRATGSVELTSGGSGSVDGITVDGVAIMSGAEAFDSDLATTAQNVVDNINAHTSSPNYSASLTATSTVTITAAAGTGTGPNGFVVASSTTTIATTDTNMSGGVNNRVTSITVDGIEILSTAVAWTASNSVTAANVATQIDNYNSSPEYTAGAEGSTVTISAVAGSGDSPNGFVVAVTTDTGGSSTIATDTPTNFSGGEDAVTGQAQISTVTIGGTFEVGDRFSILLAKDGATKRFGVNGNPDTVGTTALTFKTKLHTTVGPNLWFSGVGDATWWNRNTTTVPGASFINMSAQDEGAKDLTALQVYQGNLAVFARNVILVWSIDADPELNVFLQPIKNTGTRSAKSVLAYGNNDVFYLSDSGIRSIRARDSSNAAYVSDVGTPIDPLVIEWLQSQSAATVTAATAVLEPRSDRYWLAVGTRIFVFSYFPGSEVSAWSYYDVTDDIGAAITDFARTDDKVYARSGDTVYLYGGDAGTTYPDDDEVLCTVEFPFLDGNKPATKKMLSGFDIGCEGQWKVELYIDPEDTSRLFTLGTVKGTTFFQDRAGFDVETTHFAPRLVCSSAGAAKVSMVIVHWRGDHEEG